MILTSQAGLIYIPLVYFQLVYFFILSFFFGVNEINGNNYRWLDVYIHL